jgi:hypothetical protein
VSFAPWLAVGLVADGEPGDDVARSPRGAGEPLARQPERDRAPLAQGFLDQALDVQRPIAVGCVEQERKVGHGQMTLR